MQVRVIKPGLLSTIQDLGRQFYRAEAVPVSGAMDALSARLANIAVCNPPDAAVIELTYSGTELEAETDILMAYCGDGAFIKAGNVFLPANRPVFIPAKTMLYFSNNAAGSRSYLAVYGGWDVPQVLGSKSTYTPAGLGGFMGRMLHAGDVLHSCFQDQPKIEKVLQSSKNKMINYPKWHIARELFLPAERKNIRIVPAQELNWFTGKSIAGFLSDPYTLSQRSNRMGYHLEGGSIHQTIKKQLLSTAVAPGTIQVTGNGSMILLMADCQTTGGYPRIAQVAAVDLPLCGQLKPGDMIYFKEVCRREAEMLYLEREQQLQKLSITVRHKFNDWG